MTGFLVVCVLYLVVFALAELLYQRGLEAHLTRKITHIGGGLVSAGLPFFVSLPTALVLGVFF